MSIVRRAGIAAATAAVVLLQLLTASGPGAAPARRPVTQLRIVNYYPANAGWTRMWTSYSHARTASDFRVMKTCDRRSSK